MSQELQDQFSIVFTVVIIAGIFVWPFLLETLYPRCTRLLAGLRGQRPPEPTESPRPQRRRTDGQRRSWSKTS